MENEKPLFIPLKRKYFEAFATGEKKHEYRLYGPRWHEGTCRVGRRVTLSLGYGIKRRMSGTITSFDVNIEPWLLPGWLDCYLIEDGVAAVIGIKLDEKEAA